MQEETTTTIRNPGGETNLHRIDPGASQGRHRLRSDPRGLLQEGLRAATKEQGANESGGQDDQEDQGRNRQGRPRHRRRSDSLRSQQSQSEVRSPSIRSSRSGRKPRRSSRRRSTPSLRIQPVGKRGRPRVVCSLGLVDAPHHGSQGHEPQRPRHQLSSMRPSTPTRPGRRRPQTATAESAETAVDETHRTRLNDRDLVQNLVRDNPEMAVAIIGKWLQSAGHSCLNPRIHYLTVKRSHGCRSQSRHFASEPRKAHCR